MKKPTIRIADIEREMTDQEYELYLLDQEQLKAEQKARETELANKIAARQAILDRLGLTAEEAALLFP